MTDREKRQYEHMVKDETGHRYGMLTVLERAGKDKHGVLWKCRCDCGNFCIIRGIHLRSGRSTSCGCSLSRGEMKIAEFLRDHGIHFERQYKFSDCRSSKGAELRFDFAVFGNSGHVSFMIEYQGVQHYKPVKHFGGKEALKRGKSNDTIKKEYCKRCGIPLVHIKYDDDLSELLLWRICLGAA